MTAGVVQHMIVARGPDKPFVGILEGRYRPVGVALPDRIVVIQLVRRRRLPPRIVKRVSPIVVVPIELGVSFIRPVPLLDLITGRVIQNVLITGGRDIVVTPILKRRNRAVDPGLTDQMPVVRVFGGPLLVRQRVVIVAKLLILRSLPLIIPRPLLNLMARRVIQHMLITSRRDIILAPILERRMTSIRRRLTNKVTILGVLSGPLLIRQRIMTITKLLIQRSLRLIIARPLLNLNAIRVIQHMLITSRRNIIIIAILKRRMTSIRRRLTNEMTIFGVLGRPLLIRQRVVTITKLLVLRSLRLIIARPLLNLDTG
ncbi:hypothetical protein [Actinoplanes sp. NPDC049265]|uniref:hypothetical protein n=1 Tax=Actinoplanes sp. NPDC049265 TaxID=3363902 RepID=UPI00371AA4EE